MAPNRPRRAGPPPQERFGSSLGLEPGSRLNFLSIALWDAAHPRDP